MQKRIAFIEPGAPGYNVYSKFPMPRTGPVLLATILRDKGYDVRVFVEDVKKIRHLEKKWIGSADIVCISTTTSTASRAYEFADYWREQGKVVIMGGVHVTFMDEEALEHADYVIRREGEESLPELVSFLEEGIGAIENINGVSYLGKNGIIRNPNCGLIKDLDDYPVPDFSLVEGSLKSAFPIITSRGCTHGCDFCSVVPMFGRGFRFKSVQKVLDEIKQALLYEPKPSSIFFADDNFAANIPRAKKVLRGIISAIEAGEIKPFRWATQIRANAAKNEELIRLMREAGCRRVYVGFESTDDEVLKQMDKELTVEELIHAIKILKRYDIQIHAMFVSGRDDDKGDAAKTYAEFASEWGIETIQILISTPLPGAPLYEKLEREKRIIHKKWSLYDLHHCIVKQLPGQLPPDKKTMLGIQGMSNFYSWGYVAKQLRMAPSYFFQERSKGVPIIDACRTAIMLALLGVGAKMILRKM